MKKEIRSGMWKAILTDRLCVKHGITIKEALSFINNTIAEIDKSIKAGHEVKIPNFGVFYMRKKKERMGNNPQTMERHVISKRSIGCLRYSRVFKETFREEVK